MMTMMVIVRVMAIMIVLVTITGERRGRFVCQAAANESGREWR
jgi:hypothetical protein